jgi:hypothetical protein
MATLSGLIPNCIKGSGGQAPVRAWPARTNAEAAVAPSGQRIVELQTRWLRGEHGRDQCVKNPFPRAAKSACEDSTVQTEHTCGCGDAAIVSWAARLDAGFGSYESGVLKVKKEIPVYIEIQHIG